MKVWVIREEEEGKVKKEGRAVNQYFKHNQLRRAWGWRGARRLVRSAVLVVSPYGMILCRLVWGWKRAACLFYYK